jgi:hypothetical protein
MKNIMLEYVLDMPNTVTNSPIDWYWQVNLLGFSKHSGKLQYSFRLLLHNNNVLNHLSRLEIAVLKYVSNLCRSSRWQQGWYIKTHGFKIYEEVVRLILHRNQIIRLISVLLLDCLVIFWYETNKGIYNLKMEYIKWIKAGVL